MSTTELLEIVHQLEVLDKNEVNFILAQYFSKKALTDQKSTSKKAKKSDQNTLPPHIKKEIGKSLEAYKRGEYVIFGANEEFNLESVEKKLVDLECGINQKPVIF